MRPGEQDYSAIAPRRQLPCRAIKGVRACGLTADAPADLHRLARLVGRRRRPFLENPRAQLSHARDRRVVEHGVTRAGVDRRRAAGHSAGIVDRRGARRPPRVESVRVVDGAGLDAAVHGPRVHRERSDGLRLGAERLVRVRADAGAGLAADGAPLRKPEARLAAAGSADPRIAALLCVGAVAGRQRGFAAGEETKTCS